MMRGQGLPKGAIAALLVSFLLNSLAAQKGGHPFDLRLQPLLDGRRSEATKEDPVGAEAAKVGLDLSKPDNPVVAAKFADGRLFYVFYKVTEEAFGDRAWVIQRIRKVERTWATADDARPAEKVTWQVEAFKTIGGTLKGGDQHFGSFALRGAHRREVVKEYEIGFGEVPGQAEGAAWPFDIEKRYHLLQAYGEDASLHDKVTFDASRKWTLTVQLAADGSHRVVAPELGLDLPKKVPGLELAKAKPDAASKAIVLTAGEGPAGVTVGTSKRADVDKVLGAPLEDVPTDATHRNCSYRGALTCNFEDGVLNTVFTRPCFAGKTKEGITLGMPRATVRQKLGAAAKGLSDDDAQWTTPGLTVLFDAAGAVSRLVVTRR